MGAATPVVGSVLGMASAIQQHTAARQQARAQRQAIDHQIKVEEANTRARLLELERQKLYSDFSFQIQSAAREIQRVSDQQELHIAELQDQLNRQQQQYAVRASTLQQLQDSLSLDAAAGETEYAAKTQALNLLGAESEQGREQLIGLANKAATLEAQRQDLNTQKAQAFAQFSGGAIGRLGLSDEANLMAIDRLSENELQAALKTYNDVVDQVRQGKLNAQQVADLLIQQGVVDAETLRQSGIRTRDVLQLAEQANLADIATVGQQNLLALRAAASAQNTAYTIDEAQQRLNKSFYDMQQQSQANAVRDIGAGNKLALQIQKAGIQNPSTLGLLTTLAQGGMFISDYYNRNRIPQNTPKTSQFTTSQLALIEKLKQAKRQQNLISRLKAAKQGGGQTNG